LKIRLSNLFRASDLEFRILNFTMHGFIQKTVN